MQIWLNFVLAFRCANREFIYLISVIESTGIGPTTVWTLLSFSQNPFLR